ncbi:hypothetical protein H6783_03650 [Candidatus Nomurabacteria bacterium]|nr:hypothetical protein [Candidatus Nomurabacteria bacterium]
MRNLTNHLASIYERVVSRVFDGAWYTKLVVRLFKLDRYAQPYMARRRASDQLSIWTHRPSNGVMHGNYNASGMFVDDITLGIMPMTGFRNGDRYITHSEPALTREEIQIIAEGLSERRGYAHDLTYSICDFVQRMSKQLLMYGEVYFEVVKELDENGSLAGFELKIVPSHNLYRIGKSYFQIISPRDAKEAHVGIQVIKIPADKILVLNLPNELGNKRKLYKNLQRLYMASKETIPEFQMQAMQNEQNIGFNAEEFQKNKYIQAAILTKKFGWDQREGITRKNHTTEYYSIYRYIVKKKAQLIIRDKLIDFINEALERMEINSKVSIENLYTMEDVERQFQRLREGNVRFIDIHNELSYFDT